MFTLSIRGRRSSRRDGVRLPRRPAFAALLSISLALPASGCAGNQGIHVKHETVSSETSTFIQRAPPPVAGEVIEAAADTPGAAALATWLRHYLGERYQVAHQRYFRVPSGRVQWALVSTALGNAAEPALGACVEVQPGHDPGHDLATVWRIPAHPYRRIAVAALTGAAGRERVIGYFELELEARLRDADALAREQVPCPGDAWER